MAIRCTVCGADVVSYAELNKHKIFKCPKCGFGQTDVAELDVRNFYESDYFGGKTARFSQTESEEADFGKKWWVDQFVRIGDLDCLEVGPGPAAMVAGYLKDSRPRIRYEAVEISQDASNALQAKKLPVYTGRIYDKEIADAVRGRFDCVIATEVIEHDLNPEKFVRGLYEVLREGGRACLTTGNFAGLTARLYGAHWYYLDPPAHVVFYTPRSAKLLFERVGFRKVTINCVGLNYVRMHRRFPIPGFLHLIDRLQVPTGMTICAER